jgi:hypothetical protein
VLAGHFLIPEARRHVVTGVKLRTHHAASRISRSAVLMDGTGQP